MTTIPPSIQTSSVASRTLGGLLGIPPAGDAGPPIRSAKAHVPLPLRGVTARVAIVGDCALTELTERYANPNDVPLDVRHVIPLPAGAAVIGVEIRAADRAVHGRCMRTIEARRTFDDARARGKTAAMLVRVRDDVHEMSLGNVPPRAEVTVKLRMVERLRVDAGRFEYRLPTAMSPKYVPGRPVGHEGEGWSPDTDQAPDASRLTPPILLAGRVPLDLEVTMAAGATDIQASLALERLERPDGTTLLRPAHEASCQGDVVLRFWGRGHAPVLRAYTDGTSTLVVVDPPADRRAELERPREAVYVLDRSGSMLGPRLEAARRAIAASIKRLGPGDRLQVIAFSDSVIRSAPQPEPASPEAVAAALAWLDAIAADGGTKALPALREACTEPVAAGYVRTVLFVTDGSIANDQQLLQLASRIDPATRVFAVGVGRGPSMALLERLARLGGGSHLVVNDNDLVESEIERFDACMLGPIACGVHEACNDASPRTDLFAARAATFLVDGARRRVRVESVDGRFAGDCDVLPSPMPLGALWARTEVDRLEDRRIAEPASAEEIDERIAALGVAHRIQTRLTAFVAVDEASQVNGEGLEMVQPVPVPVDLALAARLQRASGAERSFRMANICTPTDERDAEVDYLSVLSMQAGSRRPRTTRSRASRAHPTAQMPHLPRNWFADPAVSPEKLREWLVELERARRIVSEGGDVPMDPTLALAVLIMLEACRTSRLGGRPLPPELQGFNLTRGGRLWKRCRRRITLHLMGSGGQELERALRGTSLPDMLLAAAGVLGS